MSTADTTGCPPYDHPRGPLCPPPETRGGVSVAKPVTVPPIVYDALLRLAAGHKRAVCDCENCSPGQAFEYDNCECGEDWSTCRDDVAVLDQYVPNWRDGDAS